MRTEPNALKGMIAHRIINPVGVDLIIGKLQDCFADNLLFCEKIFGRAMTRGYRRSDPDEDDSEIDYLFPAVWQGQGKDEEDVMLLDNYKGYCFFFLSESETPEDYDQTRTRGVYTRPLSAIFRVNMAAYKPDEGYQYIEVLKQEILKAVSLTRLASPFTVELLNTWDTPEEVFAEWTFEPIKTQALYWPWVGIRLDFDATYIVEC